MWTRGKSLTAALATTCAITCAMPQPSEAANVGAAIVGGIVGGILGGLLSQHDQRHVQEHSPRHSGSESAGSSDKSKTNEAALAVLGKNKDLAVLSSMTFKSVAASAGTDDSNKIGKSSDVRTAKVDLPLTLSNFVTEIGRMLQTDKQIGDVNEVSVEAALDEIYTAPGPESLRQFEQLGGYTWSAEQLKVDILTVARPQLKKFGVGNNRGMIQMAQVKSLLVSASHEVYVRTFELTELIAMNTRIADFDRRLWERSGAVVAQLPGANTMTDSVETSSEEADIDDDTTSKPKQVVAQSGVVTTPADAKAAENTPNVPKPSKMSHIDSEMVRIAQLLVDDLGAEATRGMRDLGYAARYRVERATIDCFTRLAAPQITVTAGETPQASSAALDDQKYVDLINLFQKSIEKKDAASGRDQDGECRQAALILIGPNAAVVAEQNAKAAAARDAPFLRDPQPIRAVWTGKVWDNDHAPSDRSN